MNRLETNRVLLNDLEAFIEANPDQRFFQALTNLFGFPYLGTADSPEGAGFKDLWNEEVELQGGDDVREEL